MGRLLVIITCKGCKQLLVVHQLLARIGEEQTESFSIINKLGDY